MTALAQRYIQLAYGIQDYFPGYIDAYTGPEAWKQAEKKSLEALSRDAKALHQDVDSSWLEAQVNSMRTVLDILRGELIPYRQEIREVYDIDVEPVPEKKFEEAIANLNSILPGQGNLVERLEFFRDRFTIRTEYVFDVVKIINDQLRKRTKALFDLPRQESFDVERVNNKPWGGYNWYLGNYQSRIDLNTDLPVRLHALPHLLSHEAYPGHHTEHVLKDKHLCQEQQKLEHSIFLINSPEAVQAEGIAETALKIVMNEDDVTQLLEELLPIAKVKADKDDVHMVQAIQKTIEVLGYVSGNAALLLHEEKRSVDEVQSYLEKYNLSTAQRAKKSLEFLQAPTARSYVFTYTVGKDLLAELLKKGNAKETFHSLLLEAYTPGMIRAWIKR
jgi:hypothetical protein